MAEGAWMGWIVVEVERRKSVGISHSYDSYRLVGDQGKLAARGAWLALQ
jgi:hypothetical protein